MTETATETIFRPASSGRDILFDFAVIVLVLVLVHGSGVDHSIHSQVVVIVHSQQCVVEDNIISTLC